MHSSTLRNNSDRASPRAARTARPLTNHLTRLIGSQFWLLLVLLLAHGPAAAAEYADMRTWELQGVSGGNWVDPDNTSVPFPDATSGRTVYQTVNVTAGTMFLLSNDENVINRTFTGTVRTDDPDNDWMGFVMGYINEDGDSFPEQYIGFNWSQRAGSPYSLSGIGNPDGPGSDDSGLVGGQFLVYVDRDSTTDDDTSGNPRQAEVIDSNAGGTEGAAYDPDNNQNYWDQSTTYSFSITYTTDFVTVSIDGVKVLEATPADVGLASFKAGRFGFSNASQAKITYGNVQFSNASVEEADPVAVDDDRYGIDLATEGTTLNVDRFNGVLVNDTDPDGDTFHIVTNGDELTSESASTAFATANSGSVTIYGDGSFQYTANSGFEGEDTFTYALRDSDGNLSDPATVTITVINDNQNPTAINVTDVDTGTTPIEVWGGAPPDTPVADIEVIDPNGNDKFDIELTDASNGAFKVIGNRIYVRNTDALDAADPHQISIEARDLEDQSVTLSNVAIDVLPNNRPTTSDNSVSAGNTANYTFADTDFAFTDADSGDSFTQLEVPTTPANGDLFVDTNDNGAIDPGEIVQINVNDVVSVSDIQAGRLKYVAVGGFTGTETFQFAVGEGKSFSEPATMTVTDVVGNQAPVAVNDDFTAVERGTINENVLLDNGNGADSDPEGSPVTVTVAQDENGDALVIDGSTSNALPSGATLVIAANGDIAYTAPSGMTGGQVLNDRFTYRLSDGTSTGAPATAAIEVTGIDDVPEITSNGGGATASISVDENTTAITTVTASDPDSGGLTFGVSGTDAGAVSVDAGTGVLTFDSAPDYETQNSYTVVVSVTDGTTPDEQTLTITINDIDEAPVAAADSLTVSEIDTLNANLLIDNGHGADADPEGAAVSVATMRDENTDPLVVDGVTENTLPSGAVLIADSDGNITYTPPDDLTEGQILNDTFSYALNDGGLTGAPATVTVSVNGVDQQTDTDNDGTPDIYDADDDGDGIPDNLEAVGDSDGDGIDDSEDSDADGDGVPDSLENPDSTDSDGDGIPDRYDVDQTGGVDSDGDGVDDFATLPDTDGDGTPDALDPDQDGDGLPDAIESGATGNDSDNDGIDDAWDVDKTGGEDADNDGIDDDAALRDTDGDGTPDMRDLDSDGDSVTDAAESGASGVDADGDGIDNAFDVDYTGGTDGNGDGIDDANNGLDTDGDGVPDYRDLDSDNDGLYDVTEAGGTDADSDALADEGASLINNPQDSDNDGTPDLRDLDSNDDGTFDIVDAGFGGLDNNGDGRIDATIDADGDGLDDTIDNEPAIHGSALDPDGDGVPSIVDLDDDNDGIPDTVEGEGDADGDGIPNYLDTDSDNDGIPDSEEGLNVELSGNDSDGDGLDDAVDVDFTGGVDRDGDGADDRMLNTSDRDGDGLPDWQDTDSDGDGVPDTDENEDFNGDGIPDREQDDPGIRTGLEGGAGGTGPVMLIIALLTLLGRARRTTVVAVAALLAGMLFPITVSAKEETVSSPSSADDSAAPAAADDSVEPEAIEQPGINNVAEDAGGAETLDAETVETTNASFNRWYGGLVYGQSMLDPDDSASSWRVRDDGDSAWQIYGGYRVTTNWAVELGYADLGSVSVRNLNPAITGEANIEYTTPGVFGVYSLAFGDSDVVGFLKLGYANLNTSATDSRVREQDVESSQIAAGGGIEYSFNENFRLRLAYDYYDEDAQFLGVGVTFR